MNIIDANIKEVKIIEQFCHQDNRGTFIKTFHQTNFENAEIFFNVKESFFSTSHQNVLRGMHFHHNPKQHAKIVFCTDGKILDVALDIRKDSPTFGKCVSEILSFENNKAMYIPEGFAHGFLTLSKSATTYYLVSGEYSPAHDDGILYNSFGLDWNCKNIITNERDLGFQTLEEFKNK